jgi:hypothetical protein
MMAQWELKNSNGCHCEDKITKSKQFMMASIHLAYFFEIYFSELNIS